MCLILLGVKTAPDVPFILAANRDEFYGRPTAPMDYWQDRTGILAGRDLTAGGTWLGIHPSGRFAALTNYRDPASLKPDAPSRGDIIPECLLFDGPVPDFLERLETRAQVYNGFNLLAGDLTPPPQGPSLYWFSNRSQGFSEVPPGVHGVSNHLMNTAWPKVSQGKAGLSRCMETGCVDDSALFALLGDTRTAPDDHLPDTGIGLEWERLLSPLFIQSPTYGTRSSTIVRMNENGAVTVTERSYDPKDRSGFTDRSFKI